MQPSGRLGDLFTYTEKIPSLQTLVLIKCPKVSNMAPLSIFLSLAYSAAFLIGLLLCCLIISYLKKRPQEHKTAFDQALIDSITLSLIFGFSVVILVILYLNFAPLPFIFASIVTILQYFAFHSMISSWFVTMVIKYLFIFHGNFMFDYSDNFIWITSNFSKGGIHK